MTIIFITVIAGYSVHDIIRIYGSLFVIISGFLCGIFTIILFIDAELLVGTIGLVGFAVYVFWTIACAILSFGFDLVGNAKAAFRRSYGDGASPMCASIVV